MKSTIILISSEAFAQTDKGSSNCGYYGCGGFMGMSGGIVEGIVLILFWVFVIIGTIYLAKYILQNSAYKQSNTITKYNKTSMDILEERYAKGEIDKDEFEQRKKDLMESN